MALYTDPDPDVAELGFGHGEAGRYWQLHDPEWLHDAHVVHGLGTKRLAREIGCVPKAVRVALRRHNISRPLDAAVVADPRLEDRTWVADQYITRRKSTHAIAREVGCAPSTVRRWLNSHGIELRDRAEAARI